MNVREAVPSDLPKIIEIVNAAAEAYRGVIPADCWQEPYMSAGELEAEVAAGVRFWVAEQGGLLGAMGLQDRGDAMLVRHAYVAPGTQRSGVGSRLLERPRRLTDKPLLIGTWADASWAIGFYRKNGFALVEREQKDQLLRKYWSIPACQAETSVVLADARWRMS